MKRRAEHLVLKRDGRREFLRATKLARSIHLALFSVGVDEDWRALELANVVLQALRQKQRMAGEVTTSSNTVLTMLTTSDLSDAVQHVLVVTGQPTAAVSFGAVAAERSRRRQSLATMSRSPGLGLVSSSLAESSLAASSLAARERRLTRE